VLAPGRRDSELRDIGRSQYICPSKNIVKWAISLSVRCILRMPFVMSSERQGMDR
jgi:hypothetical protein